MDLRAFVERLRQCGKLRTMTGEVDWRYELGHIARSAPMPTLFENIKGYPRQRVFTNGLASVETIALALGLRSKTRRKDLVKELRRRIATPIPPTRVASDTVFENAMSDDEIDLLALPVPHWHQADAGRYIGTWHVNISRDPESGVYNLGVYRMQVVGPRRATISTSTKSHLGQHFLKAESKRMPLKTVVAIGVSEAVMMAAASGYPCGKDEYELAGAMQQASVELVKCKSVDLEAPANAEILIEGFLHPGVRTVDGPYFDYAGKATENPNAFLFEATRMYYRNAPIFRGAVVGHPGAEDLQLFSLLAEVGLFDFHSSRTRRAIQNFLLQQRLLRPFQWTGRIGPEMMPLAPFPKGRRVVVK